MTLKSINENYMVVSKYKELSVAKLWPYINEISELNLYFSNWKKISFQKETTNEQLII